MFWDITMLFDPPSLFSILHYLGQDPGWHQITDASGLVMEVIWSDVATYSQALKYIINLLPDWRLVCHILIIVDSSSLVELSICGVMSTATGSCRYKLTGLLKNKSNLNSQLASTVSQFAPAINLSVHLGPVNIRPMRSEWDIFNPLYHNRDRDLSLVRLVGLIQLLLLDNIVSFGFQIVTPEATRVAINVLYYALCKLMYLSFPRTKQPFNSIGLTLSLHCHPAMVVYICYHRQTLPRLARSRINKAARQYRS